MNVDLDLQSRVRRLSPLFGLLLTLIAHTTASAGTELPWREAGLSERQAAAHLLDRLAFGARPGDVERLVEVGLERWVELQLEGSLPEPELKRYLSSFKTLDLSNSVIAERYPSPGVIMREAQEAGVFDGDSRGATDDAEQSERRAVMVRWAREQGYGSQRELLGELADQKIYRAAFSENQLHEVLTEFWFNHFNVSRSDNQARAYIGTYERDAIRPHVLGGFRDLLGATASHPAMLLYLDNAQSTANEGQRTLMDHRMAERTTSGRFGCGGDSRGRRARGGNRPYDKQLRGEGLNENYARELLELHTLGVDGGYAQNDVIEVARAFTGWSAAPPRFFRGQIGEDRLQRAFRTGMLEVGEDGFLFRVAGHDAEEKTVLGERLLAGRGLADGEQVLDIVSRHPSTADHLSLKLARRFVSDEPPQALVTRMAGTYRETGGDLKAVMETLIGSPEFWDTRARGQKIKSPLELVASSLRALDADLPRPREAVKWVERMGQPLYAYEAPTGYPDRAAQWVNTGALLNRMNFGLALANGQVRGVEFDLADLNGGREPESLEAALATYASLLMPERDLAQTIELLKPMVLEPALANRVAGAAPPEESQISTAAMMDGRMDSGMDFMAEPDDPDPERRRTSTRNHSHIAQVVGVILGSPEFQRH